MLIGCQTIECKQDNRKRTIEGKKRKVGWQSEVENLTQMKITEWKREAVAKKEWTQIVNQSLGLLGS